MKILIIVNKGLKFMCMYIKDTNMLFRTTMN